MFRKAVAAFRNLECFLNASGTFRCVSFNRFARQQPQLDADGEFMEGIRIHDFVKTDSERELGFGHVQTAPSAEVDGVGPVSGLVHGRFRGTLRAFPEHRSSDPVAANRFPGAHTVAGQRRIHTCFPCIQHERSRMAREEGIHNLAE